MASECTADSWANLLAQGLSLKLVQQSSKRVKNLQEVVKKHTLQALHRSELRRQECTGALDEVGVVVGSELNPVKVAIDTMLGGDSFRCEVLAVEKLEGIEDVLEVEHQVVLRVNKGRGNKVGDARSSPLLSAGHLREIGCMSRGGMRPC